MTEKQNAEMLELARALEVQLHSHSPLTLTSSTVREIVAALRAPAPSPHPRGEPENDELGLFDLGQSFLEEYERAVREGHLPDFMCAQSPVEVLWHLINEVEEAKRAVPSPHPSREEIARIIHPRAYEMNEATPGGNEYSQIDISLAEEKADTILALFAAPPPAGADAVREALKPFAAVAEYDIGETESDADIYRPMSKNNRAPLLTVGDLRRAYAALLPAPPPQEKPTGDQT